MVGTVFGTVLAPYWHRVSTVFCTVFAPCWHLRCKLVKSCRAYTGLSLKAGKLVRGEGGYTDHNLLVMELKVPSKKKCKKLLKGKIREKTVKYDISKLQTDEFKKLFADTVANSVTF